MKVNQFISDFLKRKGAYVFFAVIVSKLFSLLLSVVVIRLLTKEDYGNLMYAYTIISFVMPFMGMGVFQSFIRYAPLQKFIYQRKALFKYTFIGGVIASVILSLFIVLFAPLISHKIPESYWYIVSFSLLIVSLFIFESIKNYFRISFLNQVYAKLEIIHSISVFIIGVSLTYFIGAFGFIIALIIVPLILSVYLLLKKKIFTGIVSKIDIPKKEYWYYGIYTSLGGLLSQLIFSIDIIGIGNLLNDAKLLAQYKALSIIPFSLLFLPGAVIKTDFVKLVNESKNRAYLISYVKNFMIIFSGVSVLILVTVYFLGDWIVVLLFGQQYMGTSDLLLVFTLGIIGAFLFRVPFGNIMVVIGKTKINTLISILTLLADVVLNYFWIQKWGIMGAAYATSLLLWLSGIATYIVFRLYIAKLSRNNS